MFTQRGIRRFSPGAGQRIADRMGAGRKTMPGIAWLPYRRPERRQDTQIQPTPAAQRLVTVPTRIQWVPTIGASAAPSANPINASAATLRRSANSLAVFACLTRSAS
ncbi:hypothetical protein [Xanthomonas floridensis]|nr:hypothetical protein [Xanthomonas floridensis]MEA5126266.1 hypothetical protein [Xanthomonas floridensis]MEA5134158.1 hypothetical protein [Xanthomonas floridensis]